MVMEKEKNLDTSVLRVYLDQINQSPQRQPCSKTEQIFTSSRMPADMVTEAAVTSA